MKLIPLAAFAAILCIEHLQACPFCQSEQGLKAAPLHRIGELTFIADDEIADDTISAFSRSIDVRVFNEHERILSFLSLMLPKDEYRMLLSEYLLRLPAPRASQGERMMSISFFFPDDEAFETIEDFRSFFTTNDNLAFIESHYGKASKGKLLRTLASAKIDKFQRILLPISDRDSDYADVLAYLFDKAAWYRADYRKDASRFRHDESVDYFAQEIPFLEIIAFRVFIRNLLQAGEINFAARQSIFRCIRDYNEKALAELARQTTTLTGHSCLKHELNYLLVPQNHFSRLCKWDWNELFKQFQQQINGLPSIR